MTNEITTKEAIEFLELEKESTKTLWDNVNHEGGKEYFEKSLEIIDMAIKALKQQPFINKPCISEGVCREDKIQVLDKIRAEIKEWYWQADKQALAKDPCVVDAMIDLFIRTIDKYKTESENER